jgi:hypothetical protein
MPDSGSKRYGINLAQSNDQDLLSHHRDTEKGTTTINTRQDLHDNRINGFIHHPLALLAKDTKNDPITINTRQDLHDNRIKARLRHMRKATNEKNRLAYSLFW